MIIHKWSEIRDKMLPERRSRLENQTAFKTYLIHFYHGDKYRTTTEIGLDAGDAKNNFLETMIELNMVEKVEVVSIEETHGDSDEV